MIKKTSGDKKVYELTDDECKKLLKAANGAMKNTYPKSDEGFAVALMTEKGNIYTGVSYRSDTETLTMHSEATALAHAAIHGEKNIVAITGPNCHCCKQLIWESSLRSGIDTVVIIENNRSIAGGTLEEFTEAKSLKLQGFSLCKAYKLIEQIPISKLMPYPWPQKAD